MSQSTFDPQDFVQHWQKSSLPPPCQHLGSWHMSHIYDRNNGAWQDSGASCANCGFNISFRDAQIGTAQFVALKPQVQLHLRRLFNLTTESPQPPEKKMPSPANRFDRFIKLMNMTASQSDSEALTALRRANAMLDEQNMTWEEFLRAKVKFKVEQIPVASTSDTDKGTQRPQRHTDADEINPMFELLLATVHDGFRNYIESVHEWWQSKGFLTQKQYDVIRQAYLSRV